jgi:hypothetical protein
MRAFIEFRRVIFEGVYSYTGDRPEAVRRNRCRLLAIRKPPLRNDGAVNKQAAASSHPECGQDHETWREQVRLAALARIDQNAQKRLNSVPIAERRPWWWRRWPAERTRIPLRTPIADS